ncbi:hypothetical protein IMG5_131900 [Ichthyophthirius multifiliis]|uniref:P-loop containing nucleoside triphosphate hydrolase n=1 Tax=Ichthyophthirius multifiliis TaxID=5932 RepID=G0QWG3_ICHMU|nr:hypothetical protein IMG5_131900 [Ichthyophthirius multifiliis]EGR30446.1 hypothetical protein IMG5_131900 [Ichthyophthirius multifiliis]|eukprot:XP_004032033.1 hypothetical protein IMG5_131900 [Ichthyophthirius multifiliis]
MFDLGFEPQSTKILGTTRPDKQTALFSATFPKNVENLAKKLMQHRPVEISVGARGQACTNITQIIEIREEQTRLYRLLELLGVFLDKGQVIIFVDKQIEADQLYTNLLKYSYYPTVLHAGMDPDDRASNLIDFKKGLYKILIATSVSSRGIDVKNVVLVINYKCPNHIEDYIHRIGRTGRAGNKGTAVTFIGQDDEQYSLDLVKALKRSDQQVPDQLQEMANNYKKKLKSGEARVYSNQNMQGHGYSFNEQEKANAEKAKFEQQKFINFQLGINEEIEDFSDDKIIKKIQPKTEEEKEKLERKNMMSLQQKLAQIKDKEEYRDLYEQILSESKKAADKALQAGQSSQKIQEAAEEAIRKALEKYRPATKSIDLGKMEIVKMLQDFEKQNEETIGQIVAELEINDYPEYARKQVLKKDFLERIYMLTNCNVVQRGVLVETGKNQWRDFKNCI